MRFCIFAAALLVALMSSASAGERPAYRLSGIVGTEGRYVAMFEFENAKPLWLRQGDRLEDGEILEITGNLVRVRFPDEDRVMRPNYGETTVESSTANLAASGGPASAREVSREAVAELNQLAADDSAGDPGDKLNSLIELPPEAEITGVDFAGTPTRKAALIAIRDALRENRPAHIWVTTPSGPEEIYVLPPPEEDPG